MDRIDLLVFGATGYTGKHVVHFLVRLGNEYDYEGLKWGVAGRSIDKLLNLKNEINAKGKDTSNLLTLVSNAEDEVSLKAMTQKCKVLINCVGPFTTLGEHVVKACIETGTHYVDISAESYNLFYVYKKYNDAAQKVNVLIVPACGFCNIPMAAGLMYLRDNFKGKMDTVELYAELDIPKYAHYPGPNRSLIHSGTWASLVYVLKDMRKYLSLRDEFLKKSDIKEPREIKKAFLHRHEGQTWFPYPGPDIMLIEMSQKQLEQSHKKKPVHFKAYSTFPRFFHFLIIPVMYLCYYLCYFGCFGKLMRNYPKVFSLGYASHAGPTIVTREKTKYTFTLIGKEWKNNNQMSSQVVKVSGKDPGYETTAAASVVSAITVLKDYSNMPKGGVVMPGAAFYHTNITSRLMKHGFKFEIIENGQQIKMNDQIVSLPHNSLLPLHV